MHCKIIKGVVLFLTLAFSVYGYAQEEGDVTDTVELTTTYIKSNKELPQTLYIVPWQQIKSKKTVQENMELHSLYGDIFNPSILMVPPAQP